MFIEDEYAKGFLGVKSEYFASTWDTWWPFGWSTWPLLSPQEFVFKQPYFTTMLSAHSCLHKLECRFLYHDQDPDNTVVQTTKCFFLSFKKMCKSQRANMKVLRCPEARYLLFLFTDTTRKWYRSLLLIPHCQHYVTWLHLATRKPGKCSLWVGCQPLMCKGETR